MRKIVLALIMHAMWLTACSQYWQQQVNFIIDVTLNDKDNSLNAFEKIDYVNNSPDTLHFIWFHLWPNAYKNDRTAYTDQALLNGDTRFYFSTKEERGYINRLDFKVNNSTCQLEDHPLYIDIVKVILPEPLPPHGKVSITTPFHVQLPFNFSRGGHDGQSYQATQWFPKPAVYDKNGWHPMPYLEQGEYYSEFGNYDVRITVPKNYVVAATGDLQNEDEKKWLLSRRNFTWTPEKQKTKSKAGSVKVTIERFPPSSPEEKTLRYRQDSVHDFAWFADKRFIVDHDTCRLKDSKLVDLFTYYTAEQAFDWKNSVHYIKQALQFYSSVVGEYRYNVVSAVQGPASLDGGMEYPTITLIAPMPVPEELDLTIAHEVGHNWFQGVLASNERDHPWMDEGINSFYENLYAKAFYKDLSHQERTLFETLVKEGLDQPIASSSTTFNEKNYNLVGYYKTSEWLNWLSSRVGTENFNKAIRDYFVTWQFKHPQPEDFKTSIEKSTGQNLDSFFNYLNHTGLLPNQHRKGTEVDFLLKPGYLQRFLNHHYNSLISISPAIGFNSYDKLMAGLFLTNVKAPLNNFKFTLAPMYAFGSKKFAGLGRVDYSFYPDDIFRRVDLFTNASTFTQDEFDDSTGKKTFLSFRKIVPGVRLTFKQGSPQSHMRSFIQWKTFLINEDGLTFSQDSLTNPIRVVTNIDKTNNGRFLNQLTLLTENQRALYPYTGELKMEQAKDFVRAGFTGNYFFNYPKNGGLNLRLFAGKFFFSSAKTPAKEFETERYHFNLSGANGFEDYTYSDYFIGRNKFEGLASQQIMLRDGGFKIKTDLLADPVGQTDNWLVATNLTSSLPSLINPTGFVQVKIFFDLGTYAEAWDKEAGSDHFLYDAGFQLSLAKNIVNVYIPLLYSNVYKDYIQSILEKKNRFFKKISFSIDLASFNLKKLDSNLSY